MTRRSLTYRRVVATSLALLWALVPLASVLHSDGHGHRYCAEHRAFEEDVSGSEGRQPAASDDTYAVAPQAGEDGHVRCPIAHPGSRDATPVGALVTRGVLVEEAPATHGAVTHAAPIDVLARAPKASPPFLLG